MQPTNASAPLNPLTIIRYGLIIALAAVFAAEAILGLQWRLLQDTPLLHYIAWLANEHAYVIYRDVFETSMPGAFIVHILIGKLFGYSDLAFRIVDLAWLTCLSLTTWLLMRRFTPFVAVAAALAFPITYLAYGPGMAMQRDYLALLPITWALLIATRTDLKYEYRALLTGCLFAAASSLKPQLGAGLPLVLIYLLASVQSSAGATPSVLKSGLRTAVFAAAGFSAVIAVPVLWLWNSGALTDFWDMFSNYLPLHVHMTGNIETVTAAEHSEYVLRKFIHGLQFYAPPAIVGVFVALRFGGLNQQQKHLVWLLAGLAIVYGLNTALGGKFWLYHWIPFRFMAALCISLLLLPLGTSRLQTVASACMLALFAATLVIWITLYGYNKQSLRFPVNFAAQVRGYPPPAPKGGKVDEIAAFLIAAKLGPDDRVLPLDWTEGAVHAMLIAKAQPASPFIYDYYFYHYVSEPYIQSIRQRHIDALRARPPRFIIDVTDKLKPSGLDTTDSFPELERLIQDNYRVVQTGTHYRILERVTGS
jgi:hypothetical protein